MIPVRLQIKGFLSYHDPVDLDFRGFDMACISGSNGAGKSSLLDAITWALFGEARRRDDTVINHRTQSPKEHGSAEVIFDFDYEAARYRVQRSKQKDKTAALDFFIQAQGESWKPLSEATLRATEERIRQILKLDYETFVNASFFLQGKADQFAQQKPGDRKRILAGILGLEVWEQYKEEALRRRREQENALAVCDGLLADIESELGEEDQRKAKLKAVNEEYEVRNQLAQANRALLEQQRQVAERLNAEKNQLQKQADEIRRLQAELDQKVDDLRSRQEEQKEFRLQIEHEKEIQQGYAAWQKNLTHLTEMESVAANFRQFEAKRSAPLLKIESERSALQVELNALTSRQNEISALESALPLLVKQVEESARLVKEAEERLSLRAALESEIQELQTEKARAKAENAVLKLEMDDIKARLDTLEASSGAECPTCQKPLAADEKQHILEGYATQGKARGERYRNNQKSFEQCESLLREKETQKASLQRVESELKVQQRQLDAKTEELKRCQNQIEEWAANGRQRLQEISSVLAQDSFAPEAKESLAEIDAELKKLGYDANAHEALRQAEINGREYQQKMSLLERASSALVPLEREVTSLERSINAAENHLVALQKEHLAASQHLAESLANEPDLNELDKKTRTLQEEANQLLTQVGYARNQVDVLKNLKVQKKTRQEEKEAILLHIAQLKSLEKAFGKDGIPALLIEQALPEIAEHANEVLDRLTNGEMSLRFETQREYKDAKRDDRKETLDIMISASAEEREYELFSGGEAFRINFAVRLALSRVLAHRAGARLQTLVIDEGFGSQDAEGRQRLIEAINYVREEFSKIIVITHLEELKDAFSARIEVSKTPSGSQVKVVAA